MPPRSPLNVKQIEARLDEYLDVEFSFIKTNPAAVQLSKIERSDQDFILIWVKRLAITNVQLAYQFINQTINALPKLDKNIIEDWALHASDVYDQVGLHPALIIIQNVSVFIQLGYEKAHGSLLTDIKNVLLHFSHGLSGRELKLEEAPTAYTDTETIFLPPVMARMKEPEENFRIYKITLAYLWAQTRYGTFRVRLSEVIQQQKQPKSFLKLFHALETRRLEACIHRELPGLYRDLQTLKKKLAQDSQDAQWQKLASQLSTSSSTVQDVLRLTTQNIGKLVIPEPFFYQGEIQPESVDTCMDLRRLKEKAKLRTVLRNISEDVNKSASEVDAEEPQEESQEETESDEAAISSTFKAKPPESIESDELHIDITMDDKPVALPEEAKGLIGSIIQDLGEIPDDYLVPAGSGEYDASLLQAQELDPDEVWKGTYHEEGAYLYQEWDFRRQHYRKNWCAVREKTVTPVFDDFIQKTLYKYDGLIKRLRKTFEAMRDENRLLKRQVDGDGVDIDALVEALADTHDGSEMSERLFTRSHRTERNIAVCFMVDMSGSTKGWVNEAERESLVLLAEALESLGDRYAIYGFSGMARKRCEIYKIKEFNESYNDQVKGRIAGIEPKDYTRMGFAIRHLTSVLNQIDAKTRILITLSDGKPDDYDTYRGEYGIEDTRRALIEARHNGIHPYCITIDETAKEYLPHMYGPAGFTVIDEVSKLPLKVSDIYRRLTT